MHRFLRNTEMDASPLLSRNAKVSLLLFSFSRRLIGCDPSSTQEGNKLFLAAQLSEKLALLDVNIQLNFCQEMEEHV